MADFAATARSNYFRVKDLAAFREAVARTSLGTFDGEADTPTEGMVAIHSMDSDHGTWPSPVVEVDEEDVEALIAAWRARNADNTANHNYEGPAEPGVNGTPPSCTVCGDSPAGLLHAFDPAFDPEYFDQPILDAAESTDVVDFLREHLADGEVAVLIEVGAEKYRYLQGYAIAFDNSGRPAVTVSTDDIYGKAKEAFGITPTAASG